MRFILPTLLILLGVASFLVFTSPTYKEVKVLKADSSQYNEALSNSTELDTERDTLAKKYQTFTPDQLDRLQKLLPDTADNIRLIIDIQSMAQTYGMSISSIKFDTPTGGSSSPAGAASLDAAAPVAVTTTDYNTFQLEFSTTGSYENFVKFIKDLESSLRLTDIESVDFTSDTQSSTSSSQGYTYTVKLQTYWLKNQTSTGASVTGTTTPSAATTAPALNTTITPATTPAAPTS